MTCIINEFRERGLVDKDWEMEARKRDNLLREPDLYHFFYWTVMYLGRFLAGGGMMAWNPNLPA